MYWLRVNTFGLEYNKRIDPCNDYKYLRTIFNTDGTNDQEINTTVIQARKAIKCLNELLWNENVTKR